MENPAHFCMEINTLGLATIEKPQSNRQCDGEKHIGGGGDDAIHRAGLNQFAALLSLRSACIAGAVGHDKACAACLVQRSALMECGACPSAPALLASIQLEDNRGAQRLSPQDSLMRQDGRFHLLRPWLETTFLTSVE